MPADCASRHAYWNPGWRPPPDEAAFREQVLEEIGKDRWIIDGGFSKNTMSARLARADVVVLFDLPMLLCLWRAVVRVLKYWGRTRPDLAEGCPERFDLEFYRYIWTYRREVLPRLEADIAADFKGHLVRIKNEADRAKFLAQLPNNQDRERYEICRD